MGICSTCLFSLLLLLLFFFFLSQTQVILYTAVQAAGKSVAKHPQLNAAAEVGAGSEVTVSYMSRIGSIPPRCERRCSSCGHCEAVQVPIAAPIPNHHVDKKRSAAGTKYNFFFRSYKKSTIVTYNSRSTDDYTSNYKPMSWKCKCGERILNP